MKNEEDEASFVWWNVIRLVVTLHQRWMQALWIA